MQEDRIAELISRRRRQILVYSCMYYHMDTSTISDYEFDRRSRELVALQKSHPEISEKCVYADAFRDFDGSTGFKLPYLLPHIIRTAEGIIRYNQVE